jgi:hypothetical protein
MKKVTYVLTDGRRIEVEYDENAPCSICGLPIVSASMGGTDICSWCDCGRHRDGTPWTLKDYMKHVKKLRNIAFERRIKELKKSEEWEKRWIKR